MALIPPFFLDCVVGIGIINNSKKQWIGTGFLYGNYIEKNTEGQNLYEVFLVTNKHVINDLSKIILRFNPQEDSPAKDYELSLNDQNRFGHPNPKIDVAIIPINTNLLKSEGMKFQFFNSDIHTFNKKPIN